MPATTVVSPRKRLPRSNFGGLGVQDDECDVMLSIAPTSPSIASTASSTDTFSSNIVNAKLQTVALSPSYEPNSLHERNNDENDEKTEKLSRLQEFSDWLRRLQHTFGLSFLLLVSTVYAVQGFTSFSALAINFFFKDNLQLQPTESQSLLTVMMVPWGIKPFYGIISDSLPLCGYHRKSYMMLCSAIGTIATIIFAIPDLIISPIGAVLVLMLNSLSAAVIDVVIDARVVEMSRLDPKYGANDLQSVSWVSMSVGGVLGSIMSGPATHKLGVRGVFGIAAIGPLTIFVLSTLMHEAKTTVNKRHWKTSARRQVAQLKGAIGTPVIWMCALWVFLSGAISPGYSQVFFYFSTDVLQFTPEFLGTVSAFGFMFLMVGTMLYNACFKDMPFRRIFFIAQLSLAIVSLLDIVLVTRANLNIGIPDKAFVLGDAVIADVISRLKTMPMMVLCAKLCPKGIEGTLFALLMSISNFSRSVSEFWGALVCAWLGIAKDDYDMLWLAIILRSALKVVPIFFLFLIPATDPQEIVDKLDFNLLGHGENVKDKKPEDAEVDGDDDDLGTVREDHRVNDCSPTDEVELKGTVNAV
ncbi:Major facilitator superfamily domain, general substrate transporter [Plasmopara halstedii]|uniref:Major facilitator superfamily domain, general substrate transporter n=1 Tax=Plasmopara halstedii TaxID=4781 RepID=A0A0P1AZI2_PLAHL|nr:Major facilitator superfamily domain, general substrate transporter [Plasmopara halstedii]CEG47852.1 Major facilitator superfamily domain, general substrate transporter [Plasmopara halstedii]|eukprot:XP_024584221.1 Major facilitator superfamily domain, general substrate transporter [Plasmopara halstedii]